MTAADFLTKILPSNLFPDNDIIAALGDSKLKEVNLPDNLLDKHVGVYLTKDRALNDSELRSKIKGENWGHFADDIERGWKKDIVGDMPEEWKAKYYAIPETQPNGIYDRHKVIVSYLREVKEKGGGEDLKTASAKWRDKEAEFHKQIADITKKSEEAQTGFTQQVNDFKINFLLKEKVMGFIPKVAPEFTKDDVRKNFLIDSTVNSLRSGFLLEFDKENPENILFLKKDRTDVYEGNSKVTLDQFLEKQMEPYVVKNNGGTPTPSKTTTVPVPGVQPPVMDARARRVAAQV